MNVEGGREGRSLSKNRLGIKKTLALHPLNLHAYQHAHSTGQRRKEKNSWGKRKSTCSLILAEVNDFHFVCVFLLSSFGVSILHAFFLLIHLLTSTALQYYVILCSLVVHKNFLLFYVFSSWFVFNWDTRAAQLQLCWCVESEMKWITHNSYDSDIQLHNMMSHGALYIESLSPSLSLFLLSLFMVTMPLCYNVKSTSHTHVLHLRDNISFAAFWRVSFLSLLCTTMFLLRFRGGNFFIPRHKHFRMKCHEEIPREEKAATLTLHEHFNDWMSYCWINHK